MSKKFYAVNRTTGERWKPRKGINEFLVMYDSGYLAVATYYDWEGYAISPLNQQEWQCITKRGSVE